MDFAVVGYLCIGLLFAGLALGVPVGVALGASGIVGMLLGPGADFLAGQLSSLPYAVTANYAYAVLPLFVLMGVLAERSGITEEVFRAADVWLRQFKGGLYQAVILGSAVFAAISGSTIVNAVVFTRIAYPEMLKYGYSRSLSIGAIAAAGSFAAMIPPSITMVIYAILTEQSVGKLLIAGIIPGILTAVVYMVGIIVMVRIRPELAPKLGAPVPMRERLRAIRWLWSVVVLVALVLGGIYLGIFPPSAAGAMGAFGVFVIFVLRLRSRVRSQLGAALLDSATVSCIIFAVLIGGLIFSRMLVVLGMIDGIVDVITSFTQSPMQFLILASVFYLVLGCFLDTTSMMVVTLPFIYPIVQHLGIDGVWFGIVLVKLVEISVITPPVGMNLFAVMSAVDEKTTFGHVTKGVVPFIALELIVLALLIAFPDLVTWLPQQMLNN
ncbi:MAG: TRAP transporter large permease subunit [Burkholderiaceae bacterium]|nr:TRAP transporter large permease subunit [Burkholderiaceae bacterium]